MERTKQAAAEISRRDFNLLMNRFAAAGWRHSHSVMDDCGTGGVVFVKDGETFKLNTTTVNALPEGV